VPDDLIPKKGIEHSLFGGRGIQRNPVASVEAGNGTAGEGSEEGGKYPDLPYAVKEKEHKKHLCGWGAGVGRDKRGRTGKRRGCR